MSLCRFNLSLKVFVKKHCQCVYLRSKIQACSTRSKYWKITCHFIIRHADPSSSMESILHTPLFDFLRYLFVYSKSFL